MHPRIGIEWTATLEAVATSGLAGLVGLGTGLGVGGVVHHTLGLDGHSFASTEQLSEASIANDAKLQL